MYSIIYDNFKGNIPLNNLDNTAVSKFYLDVKNIKLEKEFITSDQISASSNKNLIYPIEFVGIHSDRIIDSIPKKTRDIIKSNTDIVLLFYLPTEGFSLQTYDHWYEKICYHIGLNGFSNNRRVYVTGNLKISQNFKSYMLPDYYEKKFVQNYTNFWHFRHLGKIDEYYCVDYFEEDHRNYYLNDDNIKTLRDDPAHFFNYNKKKLNFLFYNRRFRHHRLALISEIFRNKLDKDCYMSCLPPDEDLKKINNIHEKAKLLLVEEESFVYLDQYIKNIKKINLPNESYDITKMTCNKTDSYHFSDTWFSLISETEYDNESLFLTEKTWKPIANWHPFVIWGNPGSLHYLRSRGYETFPEIFNESYDNEENHALRLQMILKEIKRFCTLPNSEKNFAIESIREKLYYNRKLYFSVNRKTQTYENIFRNIFKTSQTTNL